MGEMPLLLALTFLLLISCCCEPWVTIDSAAGNLDQQRPQLRYKATAQGDHIMDFSSVGYKAGRERPPYPAIKFVLSPCGGDDTQQIQQAIDEVSKMPMIRGLRGTIKLSPGVFKLGNASILIASSGIVIDGSGPLTIIDAGALDAKVLFRIYGNPSDELLGDPIPIVETAAAGTNMVTVECARNISVGDSVLLTWQWSEKWIRMINMTTYWYPRKLGFKYTCQRTVRAVRDGRMMELDVPLPFRVDLDFADDVHGFSIQKLQPRGWISNVGLQNFHAIKQHTDPGTGVLLKIYGAEDSWVDGIDATSFGGTIQIPGPEFLHTTVAIGGRRITFQNVRLHRTVDAHDGPKPFDVALVRPGQQILVRNVTVTGNREYSLMTGDSIAGPNVFYNCTGYGRNEAQPHMLFTTGLLYDNVRIPDGGIELVNRRSFGSGHGITSAFSVAWRTSSKSLQVINPPGAANWAIGCEASEVNDRIGSDNLPGFIESDEAVADIPSLYLAQREAAGLPSVLLAQLRLDWNVLTDAKLSEDRENKGPLLQTTKFSRICRQIFCGFIW